MKGLMGCVPFSATIFNLLYCMLRWSPPSERAPEATIKGRTEFLASTTSSTYSNSLARAACFSCNQTATAIRFRELRSSKSSCRSIVASSRQETSCALQISDKMRSDSVAPRARQMIRDGRMDAMIPHEWKNEIWVPKVPKNSQISVRILSENCQLKKCVRKQS